MFLHKNPGAGVATVLRVDNEFAKGAVLLDRPLVGIVWWNVAELAPRAEDPAPPVPTKPVRSQAQREADLAALTALRLLAESQAELGRHISTVRKAINNLIDLS